MTKTNVKQVKNLQKEETRNVSNHKTANNGVNADKLENDTKVTLRELVAQIERRTAVKRAQTYLESFTVSEVVHKELREDARKMLQYITEEKKSHTGVPCFSCKWSELSEKTTENVRNREIETDAFGNSLILNEPDTSAQVIANLQSWARHDETAEKRAKAKLLGELKGLSFAELLEMAKASGAVK